MEGIKQWIEAEGTGHWFFITFPVILLALFIWFKGRRVRFLIPSLIISIVIINPVFYKYWDKMGLYAYWRILWIIPVIPVVAVLVPSLTERIHKGWLKGAFSAVGVGLVVIGGTFLYNGSGGSFVEAANAAKEPDYVVQIADRLLELDEHPRVIAQDPIGVYLRQYTGEIETLYGRDMYGYILKPSKDIRDVYTSLSNGDFSSVSQFMLDEGYDYLVYDGNTDNSFEMVTSVEHFGIYKAVGKPTRIKERNNLGQVISVRFLENNRNVKYEYDNNGFIIKETHNYKEPGTLNAVCYQWTNDNYGNVLTECYLDTDGRPLFKRTQLSSSELLGSGSNGKILIQGSTDICIVTFTNLSNSDGYIGGRLYIDESRCESFAPLLAAHTSWSWIIQPNPHGESYIDFYNPNWKEVRVTVSYCQE